MFKWVQRCQPVWLAAAFLVVGNGAMAQPSSPSAVVVNGPAGPLTAGELDFVVRERIPADKRAEFWSSPEQVTRLATGVYAQRVMAAEAAKEKLDQSPQGQTYLKLSRQRILAARDRDEFFALAGNAMRHVLVDHARSRLRDKRGGGLERVPLDDQRLLLSTGQAEELLELDDALSRLTRANPRPAFVVEQRIFAGRSLSEIADWLGVSEKTVARDWTVAIAWLRKEVHASVDVLS